MTDTTAPRGTLTGAPTLPSSSVNPYGLTGAKNDFVDIDGDGDLDAFVGNTDGNLLVQFNTGSATQPAFAAATVNPYGLADVGRDASPSFVDIDGDGDLDAFIGSKNRGTVVQLNTGSATNPAFAAATSNPYGLNSAAGFAISNFMDFDGDGDLDVVSSSSSDGSIVVQLNTGSATSPAFAEATARPYYSPSEYNHYGFRFADIEGDGDLDAFIGEKTNKTTVQLNTGSAANPAFAEATRSPYDLFVPNNDAIYHFVDIDGDDDLDALISNGSGNTLVQLNTGSASRPAFESTFPASIAPVTAVTANGIYGVGSVITLAVEFNEAVIVNTAGGKPTLQLETGNTDRFAIYAGGSGTKILTFSYTVQAGDYAYYLDQTGKNALALNGSTIADAAGNNALITLADRYAPGSLSEYTPGTLNRKSEIVIDAVAPSGYVLKSANLNPDGLVNVAYSRRNFVDLDGDGDLDALISSTFEEIKLQLNTGSASSPAFGAVVTNSYGLVNVNANKNSGYDIELSFVDIDADGDLDAFMSNAEGNVLLQLNTGSATRPAFAAITEGSYGLGRMRDKPSLVDIDGDGDLDALMAMTNGDVTVQLNTGSATNPAFAAATLSTYGLADVSFSHIPDFIDIDADGDLDAMAIDFSGNPSVQLNTGSATRPAFAPATTTPYGLFTMGSGTSPNFVDIDNDGDFDALTGDRGGNTLVQLNTGSATRPAFESVTFSPAASVTPGTADPAYGVGSVIMLAVQFNENVIVDTAGGTPTLQLKIGSTERTATYSFGSGFSTLNFSYTVQAGDLPADLAQLGSTSLALNGSTIADAAGNKAILTLDTPSATGPLGYMHTPVVIRDDDEVFFVVPASDSGLMPVSIVGQPMDLPADFSGFFSI